MVSEPMALDPGMQNFRVISGKIPWWGSSSKSLKSNDKGSHGPGEERKIGHAQATEEKKSFRTEQRNAMAMHRPKIPLRAMREKCSQGSFEGRVMKNTSHRETVGPRGPWETKRASRPWKNNSQIYGESAPDADLVANQKSEWENRSSDSKNPRSGGRTVNRASYFFENC
eukprot:Gb_18126 [translate_table: standard]